MNKIKITNRSGIVNIDNPDLPDTVLYKEEHEAN